MSIGSKRIYRYDNVKAFLILLVVIGHMTTDYVSDSHMVRWITLWIYTFHMPAFIFISGLVHKQYITEERAAAGIRGETRMRWDRAAGFFLCGYGLKVFLQLTRTLMGQDPLWHWIEEPGIPWYLFVMAEYEIFFYLMRKIEGKVKPAVVVGCMLVVSAAAGYVSFIGDAFCLGRFINFLPIYAAGYYMDMKKFAAAIDRKWTRIAGWLIIAATLLICYLGKWGIYSWRKWFTGRRSYEFLTDYFSYAVKYGWAIRPAVWIYAVILTLAIIAVIPDRDLGFITTAGARTLNVYFWHRPVCYLFRTLKVLPTLVVMCGGTYNEAVAGQVKGLAFGGPTLSMAAGFAIYLLIGVLMTALFSLKIFEHPAADLMKVGGML